MCPVQDGDLPQGRSRLLQFPDPPADPLGLFCRVIGMVAQHPLPGRKLGDQVLPDPVLVLIDQRIHRPQDLRSAAVISHHHNGLYPAVVQVKLHEVLSVGAPPGINSLVRVSNDKKILMIITKHFHQLVLQIVDVLKLINHDVLQALLPLQPHLFILTEDVQCKLDQVVIIQAEALLLLVQVPVEYAVLGSRGRLVLLLQLRQGHADELQIVVRLLLQFDDLDHVSGIGEGHVPQRQPLLLVDHLQHGVDIPVVQHQETLGVLHHMAVLLQHGDAKAMECVDVAGIIVAGEVMDPLAHLVGRLVRKRHTKDIPRQDPHLVHQKSKTMGQCSGLAGACSRDDTDHALRGHHRLLLFLIQFLQDPAQRITSASIVKESISHPGAEFKHMFSIRGINIEGAKSALCHSCDFDSAPHISDEKDQSCESRRKHSQYQKGCGQGSADHGPPLFSVHGHRVLLRLLPGGSASPSEKVQIRHQQRLPPDITHIGDDTSVILFELILHRMISHG